jgi:hypothetical protein
LSVVGVVAARPADPRRLQPPADNIAALVADHLALARAHGQKAPREALPIFWPATIKALRGAGLPRKFVALQWSAWRRRF